MYPSFLIILFLAAALLCAQPQVADVPQSEERTTAMLGPGDQIVIHASDTEELNGKTFRVASDGTVRLPLLGEVKAGGSTISQFEASVVNGLRHFYKHPTIVAGIVESLGETVAVIGAVHKPGPKKLQGYENLLDILSLAEGLLAEAGNTIHITRRIEQGDLPLPGAVRDASNRYSVGEIRTADLMDAKNSICNIPMKPRDVVTVPKTGVVYVIGEVKSAGSYALPADGRMSILRLLSISGGLLSASDEGHARILRPTSGESTAHIDIEVDVREILAGRAQDVTLNVSDVLFIPTIVKISKHETPAARR